MESKVRVFLVFLGLIVHLLASSGAAKHVFTAQDLVSIPRLSGLVSSPDGAHAVVKQYLFSQDDDSATINLLLIDLQNNTTVDLTEKIPGVYDGNPVWLDSETIIFTSNRPRVGDAIDDTAAVQIWQTNIAGTLETKIVSDFLFPVDNLKYHLDSRTLAFTAHMKSDAQNDVKAAAASANEDVMTFDSLPIRHWDTFEDGKKNNIFVAKVAFDDGDYQDGRVLLEKERNILEGLPGVESPVAPFGDTHDFNFSPDGREIVFLAKPPNRKDEAWSTKTDIWIVSIEENPDGEQLFVPVSLTERNGGACSNPVYSSDGKWVAWLQMETEQYEADRKRIVFYDRQSTYSRHNRKRYHYLNKNWDRSPNSILFSLDSKELYAVIPEHGREKIFAIAVKLDDGPVGGRGKGKIRKLVESGSANNLCILPSHEADSPHSLLFMLSSMTTPPEVYSVPVATANNAALLERHSFVTDPYMEELEGIVEPEQMWFEGSRHRKVHGWVLLPDGARDATRKWPVAFLIHGGPQSAWSDSWSSRWNPNIFAAAGYITIAINPTGSTSYGQSFTDAINRNWGSHPYIDLMKGLDHAIEKYPIDKDRMCALGASYGGYMVNWIQGHTKRFRCLVNHDGVFSTLNTFYATDELYFPEHEFGGVPWSKRSVYDKWNPANHVQKWATPQLIVHGGKDYRLVDSEGISTFTALQRRGITSRFVYFPNENHWVMSPRNSLKWHEELLGWIGRFTSEPSKDQALDEKWQLEGFELESEEQNETDPPPDFYLKVQT